MELNRAAFEKFDRTCQRNEEAFQRNERAFQRNERAFRRNEEAFERNEAAFDRNTQAFEGMMAAWDRFEARWDERDERFNRRLDENEQVMWEMNRRAEKAVQVLIKQSEAFNAEQARRTDEIVAEIREARAEWREECRTHREALFALIDRLPPAEAA